MYGRSEEEERLWQIDEMERRIDDLEKWVVALHLLEKRVAKLEALQDELLG